MQTGVVRMVVDLAAGDDRRPLVQQADQRADQPGLALAALAEQDDVVAGEDAPVRPAGSTVSSKPTIPGKRILAPGEAAH